MRELNKKLDMLMDYLGLEFRYAWGEPVEITKCEKSTPQNLTKCDFKEEEKNGE